MDRQELLQKEREDAIRALQAAVFTARGVTPPLTVDDVQDIVDAANVEFDKFRLRQAEREALLSGTGFGTGFAQQRHAAA